MEKQLIGHSELLPAVSFEFYNKVNFLSFTMRHWVEGVLQGREVIIAAQIADNKFSYAVAAAIRRPDDQTVLTFDSPYPSFGHHVAAGKLTSHAMHKKLEVGIIPRYGSFSVTQLHGVMVNWRNRIIARPDIFIAALAKKEVSLFKVAEEALAKEKPF